MKLENGKLVADFDSIFHGDDDVEAQNQYVLNFATDIYSKNSYDIRLMECIVLSALNSKAKGFWDEPRNHGEMIALMHEELSEALHELRSKEIDVDKVVEEFADVVIRLFDYVGGFGLTDPFMEALKKKFLKNASRPYKHGKTF